MGVLSVLNSAKRKTFVWVSVLITSLIFLGPTAEAATDTIEIEQPSKTPNFEQLPFCDEDYADNTKQGTRRRLVYVSTLDGKLSALDILNNGNLKWSVDTGPGSLLSSSIHRMELTNNRKWVRMIPSLSGSLYQFDGESIEPIPITADNLLSSSFKFSDDLTISGGKETRSYGVSSRTGQILYECSMNGCSNYTLEFENKRQNKFDNAHDFNPTVDDVIVVRRQTQTVRAFEMRSGSERWNFSVGQHEVELVKSENCHTHIETADDIAIQNLEFKINLPDGIVCAFRKSDPDTILWRHKFDFPIAGAWEVDSEHGMKSLNVFSRNEYKRSPGPGETDGPPLSPSVYVGMFEQQLYIQENENLKQLIHRKLQLDDVTFPRIPWKPIPASSSELAVVEELNSELAVTSDGENSNKALMHLEGSALSEFVLYGSEGVNGKGYFLYSDGDFNKTQSAICDKKKQILNNDSNANYDEGKDDAFLFGDDDTPAKIVIVSLWFWWKEVLVIAITTALLLNLFVSRRKEREVVVVERHVEVPIIIEKSLSAPALDASNRRGSQRSISESTNGDNFSSRFLNDFDLVRCLGKGGFGVVFEVQNKLDDCNYAIKRIVLPNKKESRDRVMREVRTLANCEHQHIVRYFQAWVEAPPHGWQEQKDKLIFERDALSTSIDIETPSELSPPPPPYRVDNEIISNRNPTKLDSWIQHLNTNECMNFDDEMRKTKFTRNTDNNDDDSCSFIKFAREDDGESSNSVFNHSESIDENEYKHSTRNEVETNGHDDDSFQIEFKNPSQDGEDGDQNHIITMHTDDTTSNNHQIVPYKKTHRRPQSLDLSSKGRVIEALPTPPTVSNKVYLYIQMQLCRKQSLRDWLRMNDLSLRKEQFGQIFEQIVDAVEYVHVKGLIHRDLKPSNIFFSLDGQVKIGDFGLVTDMSDIPNIVNACGDESGLPSCVKHTQQVGTHLYMSPEQLQGKPYSYKVDIYSLGLILFELLAVFSTEMERILTLTELRKGHFPSDFQKSFSKEYQLLKLMLSPKPNERPTTFGIRARPPLLHTTNTEWHFELPPRRHNSRTNSVSVGSSSTSS